MQNLVQLREALDAAKAAMDAGHAKVWAARNLPAADRVPLDLEYNRAVRAFNAAEDTYNSALRDAVATEAA